MISALAIRRTRGTMKVAEKTSRGMGPSNERSQVRQIRRQRQRARAHLPSTTQRRRPSSSRLHRRRGSVASGAARSLLPMLPQPRRPRLTWAKRAPSTTTRTSSDGSTRRRETREVRRLHLLPHRGQRRPRHRWRRVVGREAALAVGAGAHLALLSDPSLQPSVALLRRKGSATSTAAARWAAVLVARLVRPRLPLILQHEAPRRLQNPVGLVVTAIRPHRHHRMERSLLQQCRLLEVARAA